jgi:vacuolar-type H+-ATPase subunit H
MATHEVEVKPYGSKNEVETRVYTSTQGGRSSETEVKLPYGQKNELATPLPTNTPPPASTFSIGGSRTDVEVKPLGTQETLIKPQRTVATNVQRPMNLEQWKNPLMATLLGITLALTLLSLSYLPRAISGAWHWGTSWLPGWRSHELQPKSYDAYDSVTKSYMHDMARPAQDSIYQQGKQVYTSTVESVQNAKDQAANAINSARDTGESLYEQAKETGERVLERAKSTVLPGSSMTTEARRAACKTAQKAMDAACDGVDMSSSWRGSNVMDDARASAQQASQQAAGVFEQAKMRASDILEHAKDAVMYPLHAAQQTASATGDRVQAAKDTITNAGANVRDNVRDNAQYASNRASDAASATINTAKDTINQAENTLLNAKDSVLGATQKATDTVLGAGQAVKDTVLNAGQAAKDAAVGAKDTIVGAGQAAANAASNTVHNVKESVTGMASSHGNVDTTTTTGRGPTRVKVEVQEL